MTAAPVLHSEVLDRLGSEIVCGTQPIGSVLTLAGLEHDFGVSRTVVREAVRVLESMGMVESKRRVGVTVLPKGEWSVLDTRLIRWRMNSPERDAQLHTLTELRLAIEPTAARLAARKAAPDVGARLVELAGRLRALGELGRGADREYLDADITFHSQLLLASGNDMLAAHQGVVNEVLAGRTLQGLTPPWPVASSLDNHEGTARAVADGDEDRAECCARAVVMDVWHELRDVRFAPRACTVEAL